MYIRELLGFKKGAPEQVYVHGGTSEGFWSMIAGGAHQQRNSSGPYYPNMSLCCASGFLGRMRETDNQHGVELALLGFDCQVANRPLLPHDQPVVL
jgi:hypothetical protein